jgi:hypothetical protein
MLLTALVTPANEQGRAQIVAPAQQIQGVTGESVGVAFVDPGYTGDQMAAEVEAHGIRLEVIKPRTAKREFVLLPRSPGTARPRSHPGIAARRHRDTRSPMANCQ